jgi:hypothetical protein
MSVISSAMKMSKSTAIGGFMTVGFGYMDYRSRVNEGESRGSAAVKAVGSNILWMIPGMGYVQAGMMASELTPALIKGVAGAGQQQARRQSRAYRANFGGGYSDTQNAYTMRQRGVQAIENNRMNTRSVLGSEARTLARYRNGQ